ncbi:MAG TPA: DUF1311 domain-containing protein [Devosia sp.]|nr:DUF1311 domain-containing protein [Devosia sp.]
MSKPLRLVFSFVLLVVPLHGANAQNIAFAPADAALLEACMANANTNAVHARSACIGAARNVCISEPDGTTTLGTTTCNQREAAWWDKLLNDNYSRLRSALSPELFSALRDAQRAWITYRDAKCAFSYKMFEGGSIRHVLFSDCMMQTTAARAIDLTTILLDWMG